MTDDFGPKPFDALNTRGLTAKREYVRGLEERADREALSLLVECLCDESWYLRDLAEHAFKRLGEKHAPVLLPHLESGLWYTRTSVAGIFGALAFRPAVPGLLRLCVDPNATVVDAARAALVAIGSGGGAFRLAHALHTLPPDERRMRLDELQSLDRALAERVQRMLRNDELMGAEDPDTKPDDHPLVRASEEGVEWELLTSPPKRASGEGGEGDGSAGR